MYVWLASPKPSELFCPDGHPFLSSFALLLRSLNTPLLPWLFRPTSLMSHSSLGLTLLPIPVPLHLAQLVSVWIRKLPCYLRLYLRIGYRLFPLHQCIGLFRCRFVAVTPVMVTQAIPSTMLHYFCLLAGIALCASLGVSGRCRIRTCGVW